MKRFVDDIKYHTCCICDSLQKNINDNFVSVSFELYNNGKIKIRIILIIKSDVEDGYIEDIIAEYEAVQEKNYIQDVEIIVDKNQIPLENIVYKKNCS